MIPYLKPSTRMACALGVVVLGSACSGSSTTEPPVKEGDNTPLNTFPASFPNRITTIETDINIDGSTDITQLHGYDADGRISMVSNDYSEEYEALGVTDFNKSFLYAGGQLIEVQTGNALEMFTYVNNLLTEYQYTSAGYEQQQTFQYDDQGRLARVSGPRGFFDDDCTNSLSSPTDEAVTDPDLLLNYSNGRLSSIMSAEGANKQTFDYDAAGNISQINETLGCPNGDFVDENNYYFDYNSNGVLTGFQLVDDFGVIDRVDVTLDEADRVITIIISDEYDTTTQTVTYNELGYPATLKQITSPPNSFSPDIVSTIEYEAQSCQVALSANPLQLATLTAVTTTRNANDPAACLYPLDQGGF